MDEANYTCEDCDRTFEYEDDGYLTDAGFECSDCNHARNEADMRRFLASDYYKIRKNYPTLDRDVAHAQRDPEGFYRACKENPESLYE